MKASRYFLVAAALLLASCERPDDGKSAEIVQLKQQLADAEIKSRRLEDALADIGPKIEKAQADFQALKENQTAELLKLKAENDEAIARDNAGKASVLQALDLLAKSKEAKQADTRSDLQKAVDSVQGGGSRLTYDPSSQAPLETKVAPPEEVGAGLPATALQKIRRFATRSYPLDSEMRQFVAGQQVKAWREMQRYEHEAYGSVTSVEKPKIVAAAKASYPDDFTMQAFVFEQEAKAFQTVQVWEKSGAYEKSAIDSAKTKWPQQWNMVVFELEKGSRK